MFELPEVETVRRDLDRDLAGKKVKDADGNPTAAFRYTDDQRLSPLRPGRRGVFFAGVSFNFE